MLIVAYAIPSTYKIQHKKYCALERFMYLELKYINNNY